MQALTYVATVLLMIVSNQDVELRVLIYALIELICLGFGGRLLVRSHSHRTRTDTIFHRTLIRGVVEILITAPILYPVDDKSAWLFKLWTSVLVNSLATLVSGTAACTELRYHLKNNPRAAVSTATFCDKLLAFPSLVWYVRLPYPTDKIWMVQTDCSHYNCLHYNQCRRCDLLVKWFMWNFSNRYRPSSSG